MKPAEHQESRSPRSRDAADRARLIERLAKPLRIKALLLDGIPLREIAKTVGVAEATVKVLAKSLKDREERTRTFRQLSEKFAELTGETYKPRMEDLGEIVQLLANWKADAVARLAEDLKSGKLGKIYEQASGSTPAVIVPNPSGWVPTGQLPPDVANAVREAGAIRQRAYRSKMSEAEKAEERAKAAARMRAKRSRAPGP